MKYIIYECETLDNPVIVFKNRRGYWDPSSFFCVFDYTKLDIDRYNQEVQNVGKNSDEYYKIVESSFVNNNPKPKDEEIKSFIQEFIEKAMKYKNES